MLYSFLNDKKVYNLLDLHHCNCSTYHEASVKEIMNFILK